MYHIVYLTTNTVNNKIYVGIHSTYNLNDGYLGSGHTIIRAIKKYGKQNFKRQILYYCLTKEESISIEKIIVDSNFINRPDVYNIQTGGSCAVILNKKYAWTDERKQNHKEKMAKIYLDGKLKLNKGLVHHKCKGKKQTDEHIKNRTSKRIGCKNTDESKKRMSEAVSYIECPYCKSVVTKTINTRYHKEKCKMFKVDNHDLSL